MKVERTSPFEPVDRPFWKDVYLVLRGTLLQVRRIKTQGLLGQCVNRNSPQQQPGRLIRTYNLQHAEVGLAADHKKIELVPKNLAQLLGPAALKQLQYTDPQQFDVVYNYVLRVRLEGEQILFRFPSSEDRAEWLTLFCSAIDIAPPLEERSEPRYHTLPRRRRRHCYRIDLNTSEPAAAALAEQQARIMRENYPQLSTMFPEDASAGNPSNAEAVNQDNYQEAADEEPPGNSNTNTDPDAEDLDTSFMIAESGPHSSTQHRQAACDSHRSSHGASDMPTDASVSQQEKWIPELPIDPSREARYKRKCMPMLVYNSRHAHDLVIRKGRRMFIDWEGRSLTPFPAELPPYQANRGQYPGQGLTTIRRILKESPAEQERGQSNQSRTYLSKVQSSASEMGNCGADDQSLGASGPLKDLSLLRVRFKKLGRERGGEQEAVDEPLVKDETERRDLSMRHALKRAQSMDLLRTTMATPHNERALRRLGL